MNTWIWSAMRSSRASDVVQTRSVFRNAESAWLRDQGGPQRLSVAPLAQGGFTLLEVVVAIGILAVVMTIVYGAFSRSMDVTRETAEVTDRVRQVQIVTERLVDELSAAYWIDEKRARFVGTKDTTSSEDARLDRLVWSTFAHRRYVGDSPESDVAELTYRVEPSPETTTGRLMRDELINPLAAASWATHSDELADGVSEFRLRYLSGGEWVDEWDGAQRKGLPEAVEVTVALAGSGTAPAERVRTIVPLPLARR
ncbi:MAG TPA: type II secretion system protein GspJ [Nitrospiria bacterium]|nr:type II secretion system protein GspJ [Nitrospiria bacterium]